MGIRGSDRESEIERELERERERERSKKNIAIQKFSYCFRMDVPYKRC